MKQKECLKENPLQFKCTITQRIVKASYDAEANSYNNIPYTTYDH